MLPSQESISHKDVLDAILSACQKQYESEDANGKIVRQFDLDHKSLRWKTHKIASPKFGAFARALEKYENKASKCINNMTAQRAAVIAEDIIKDVEAYTYAIDAKSSETRLNKLNRNVCLVDTLSNQTQTKVLSFKEEAKKGLGEAIFGKKKSDELDGA